MNRERLKQFIKDRKYLVWWVKNPENLSPEAIVEATLNYGNWQDVQKLFRIIGIKRAAEIFRRKSQPSKMGRQNYSKLTKHYFTLYFDKYAPQDA